MKPVRSLVLMVAAISIASASLSACSTSSDSDPLSEACGSGSLNCAMGFSAGKTYVDEIKNQGGDVVTSAGETCTTILSINGFSGNRMDKAEWRIGCERAIAAYR